MHKELEERRDAVEEFVGTPEKRHKEQDFIRNKIMNHRLDFVIHFLPDYKGPTGVSNVSFKYSFVDGGPTARVQVEFEDEYIASVEHSQVLHWANNVELIRFLHADAD